MLRVKSTFACAEGVFYEGDEYPDNHEVARKYAPHFEQAIPDDTKPRRGRPPKNRAV